MPRVPGNYTTGPTDSAKDGTRLKRSAKKEATVVKLPPPGPDTKARLAEGHQIN